MAKTVTDAEMRAFRKKKRDARKRLNAMLAAGEITGQEFNKRVSQLTKVKVGQVIPASITTPSKPAEKAAPKKDDTKASMTLPVAPPSRPKKKKDSVTTPTPPPAGRKTKRKPKLYDTIDPRTGKPSGKKVSASRHLANIDAFKKREKEGTVMTEAEAKRGEKAGKRVMEILGFTKKNKGSSDMRKGGMVMNTVDNRRNK
tara:strand:- start:590 stop:1189 length:600 start_codon:yes stop_codon:yes gene_type:complete